MTEVKVENNPTHWRTVYSVLQNKRATEVYRQKRWVEAAVIRKASYLEGSGLDLSRESCPG